MSEFMERARPLPADSTLQQRVKEIELHLFGAEDQAAAPEPDYIDPSYQVMPPTLAIVPNTAGALTRIQQLEAEVRRLKGEQ
jgi:hypothetical protein